MGTIIARGKGYRAIVRRKRITITKTFNRLTLARRWIHETEFAIDQLDSVGRAETLSSILQWYRQAIVETRPYRYPRDLTTFDSSAKRSNSSRQFFHSPLPS